MLSKYEDAFEAFEHALNAYNQIGDLMGKAKVINSMGNIYQFMQGNYIYLFDGKRFTGIFTAADKGLEKNLVEGPLNPEMNKGMLDCKAFIQDYTDRIVNGKLN